MANPWEIPPKAESNQKDNNPIIEDFKRQEQNTAQRKAEENQKIEAAGGRQAYLDNSVKEQKLAGEQRQTETDRVVAAQKLQSKQRQAELDEMVKNRKKQ